MVFEGPTDEAIAVYMANEDLDNTTYFDTSTAPRHRKCNLRHTLQNLEMMNVDSCQIEYGEKFLFRMTWKSENAHERLKIKMIVNGIDTTPVGVIFGGELEHEEGFNNVDYVFDTSYLVPGRYTVDVILYDEDQSGNVMFYDRCTALRFSVEHGSESIKLKHWFKDWGNAVLPCIETFNERVD